METLKIFLKPLLILNNFLSFNNFLARPLPKFFNAPGANIAAVKPPVIKSAIVPLLIASSISSKLSFIFLIWKISFIVAAYRIPLIDIDTVDLLPIHYFIDPGPDFIWPVDEELSDEKIYLYHLPMASKTFNLRKLSMYNKIKIIKLKK